MSFGGALPFPTLNILLQAGYGWKSTSHPYRNTLTTFYLLLILVDKSRPPRQEAILTPYDAWPIRVADYQGQVGCS